MKYTKQVKTGIEENEKALAHLENIERKLAEKRTQLQDIEDGVLGLELNVSRELARAELAGSSAEKVPSQVKLDAAEREVKALGMMIRGLEEQLTESVEALRQVRANLRDEESEFILDEDAALDSKWQALFESILQPAREIIVLRAALLGWPLHRFENIKFPKLNGLDTFPVVPTRREDGRLVNALLDDKGLRKLYDEAAALHRIREAVRKKLEAIDKSREARQAAGPEPVTESQDRNRYITPQPQPKEAAVIPKNERGGVEVWRDGWPTGRDREPFRESLRLHEEGKSVDEIAAQLEYYARTVEGWLAHHEGSKRKALALREQGKTTDEIVHELRYPTEQVERWLEAESVATV